MLFNSIAYIFCFLPLVAVIYFLLNRYHYLKISMSFIAIASLFFYAYWKPEYLPVLLLSIVFNFFIGRHLGKVYVQNQSTNKGKPILIIGILLNVLSLCYFKYTGFILKNLNSLLAEPILPILNITLPLAISFFTFQQIAYLVDSYKGLTKEYNFSNYAVFVAFFPQLIAGPIVHHQEMMPQFASLKTKFFHWNNFYKGLFIFVIGLFKKNVLADNLAVYANCGFLNNSDLSFFEGWFSSLSYSFQLYFDFSGYCDMAIGSALLLNIHLPINFNSPYKARNIQDFWRRWHITLSRFLRDYIYIPLGGNRISPLRTYVNLFLVFVIGGIWHGAGWGFVIWGVMHGVAVAVHRRWTHTGIRIAKLPAILLTMFFVNITWVFFRAPDISSAWNVIRSMFGANGFKLGYPLLHSKLPHIDKILGNYNVFRYFISNDLNVFYKYSSLSLKYLILLLGVCTAITYILPNSSTLLTDKKVYSPYYAIILGLAITIIILSRQTISEFIYFNF